ncbi:hypothetical protein C7S16_1963 [Burkholderia thailandensis]|uniref:Uncharacterized protein n=1 Tax=Burkholderia thailandensis TaxID=57975 RepID=A0AAW9D6G6_BURTH|nr:hypothetical protein [Burkholderia thailandensis]
MNLDIDSIIYPPRQFELVRALHQRFTHELVEFGRPFGYRITGDG